MTVQSVQSMKEKYCWILEHLTAWSHHSNTLTSFDQPTIWLLWQMVPHTKATTKV